ncbi:cell division protein FtsK [Kribbella sandramycini]|uniref:Cell division protein FtsK n=1 Tax=Kribbella sandramycini TaxID=60450 RepID=A0A7Y4L0G9_9ACTN|nr:cell division protein FtsK [Kribbella sandramycini]MBB6565775.1 S-DNA-T family DNA segregation ATPase FtsK/SpoIIIE [Kribbella sandramycini]NOL42037.1 cell division protein FtsK [Kribbella sandramycini]
MDNVHKLHPDHDDDRDETVQDVTGIVHEPAERVDDTTEPIEAEVIDGEVIEGEILTEEESAELDRRIANRGALVRRTVTGAQIATRAVVTVSTHDRTKTAGKVVLRESYTIVQGLESWAKRAWDASTQGVYRRQIKAAEAVGDREELKEWTDRKEAATERRHRRLMDLPKLAWGVLKVVVATAVGVPFLVLLIAILTKATGHGSFTGVWLGFFALIGFLIAAGALLWTALSIAGPFLVLIAAHREGKRRAEPPQWLVTTADAEWDAAIDETTIANALQALRITAITQYLKSGLKLQFITPARVDGRGTHAVVRLPAGVTAELIARRRAQLATGLHRAAKEVWPTTGTEAGILDIWIADKGALAEGAGEYPLLSGGLVDVFKGVPAGRTLRGDALLAPIMERNTMTGGMPGQGKSSAARAIMAGCALDPTAELRIWVPDTNFDFEVFKPRCASYVMGADEDSLKAIRDQLVNVHEEVQRRGELLIRYEVPAVTRELASAGVGLHPLICLLEEAHVAITDDTYGKEISKLLVEIVKLGRKRGIHMIVSTQAPTRDSMPRDVTRNCSNGIAFAVGDHVANDALLGQGAYSAGHRATELIPGTDKGTAVVKGFTGERSQILQWYYLDVAKGNDQVTPIIKRSLDAIAKLGKKIPDSVPVEIETRDLLTDLDEALGDEVRPIADVPALLREQAPTWTPYKSLTGKALRELLDREHGIKVPSTGNRYPLDPVTIRDAIVRREQDGGTDEDSGADGSELAS